jgi:hypothetical protein
MNQEECTRTLRAAVLEVIEKRRSSPSQGFDADRSQRILFFEASRSVRPSWRQSVAEETDAEHFA